MLMLLSFETCSGLRLADNAVYPLLELHIHVVVESYTSCRH